MTRAYKSIIIEWIKGNSNLQKKVRFSLWIIQDDQEVVLRLDFQENSENFDETMWNRTFREIIIWPSICPIQSTIKQRKDAP